MANESCTFRIGSFYKRLYSNHCRSFRYWYGTTLYHHTKDLLKVQRELGHKKIENTLFYVQTAESLYDDKPEKYYVATAKTSKEFDELLAESWEYIGAVQFNNETPHKFRRPKL